MDISNITSFECGLCRRGYDDYDVFLMHLYWKHGTKSVECPRCPVKVWSFARHLCGELPGSVNPFGEEPASVQPATDTATIHYCICGETKDDAMIACDAKGCPKEWFHFVCVGVTVPPEGDWVCPFCVAKNVTAA